MQLSSFKMLLYSKLYADNAEMINLSSIVHLLLWKYCSSTELLVNIVLGMEPMTKTNKDSRTFERCIIYIAFTNTCYLKLTTRLNILFASDLLPYKQITLLWLANWIWVSKPWRIPFKKSRTSFIAPWRLGWTLKHY